jgi:hypothetical protein
MPVLNTARAHVQPGAAGKRRIRRCLDKALRR